MHVFSPPGFYPLKGGLCQKRGIFHGEVRGFRGALPDPLRAVLAMTGAIIMPSPNFRATQAIVNRGLLLNHLLSGGTDVAYPHTRFLTPLLLIGGRENPKINQQTIQNDFMVRRLWVGIKKSRTS
ncbi:MAG: hypothetical protein CM15mP46_6220 [Alphaproteobacteria bacterium]|nr:MAG: hypothetical protein CM15mP46_6220 [Alphaproteobacteria bacterium]